MPSAAFSQIVNRSMSEVIVRSLATSFCTLLPVLALYFFGGETLKDFAFALIVGTASGTYSSVFIAGPVLTHWKSREPVYAARERRIKERLGYVPAYATVEQGGPVDVAPAAPRGGRRGGVPAPQDPSQGVSRAEFDEMVANLGVDEQPPPEPAAAAPPSSRPAGGRRARAARGEAPPKPPATGGDGGATEAPKPKKPRNRKHGRPR
jgi:SecD/SecF fusion protein